MPLKTYFIWLQYHFQDTAFFLERKRMALSVRHALNVFSPYQILNNFAEFHETQYKFYVNGETLRSIIV